MKIDIYIPIIACFEVVEGGLGIWRVKIVVYILFCADFGCFGGWKSIYMNNFTLYIR